MWNSVIIVLVAVGGSLALGGVFRDCDTSMCDGPAETKLTGTAPTEEQLKVLCSPMLERFDCVKNAIKDCTGKTLEELSTADNSTVASFSALLLNLQRVSEEICDEDSLLHEGYVSSVGCFNEMMKVQHPKCYREGVAVYRAFEESQKLLGVEKNPMEATEGRDCMVTAYAVACFTIELREQCGEIARATMVEILKRIQYVTLGVGPCKKEQIEIMKSTYLDFLDFEEEKKSWYLQVFNTRK